MSRTPITKAKPTTSRLDEKENFTIKYSRPVQTLPVAGNDAPRLLVPDRVVPYWHVDGRKKDENHKLSDPEWKRLQKESERVHKDNETLFWKKPDGYRRAVRDKIDEMKPGVIGEGVTTDECILYMLKCRSAIADANDHGVEIDCFTTIMILLDGLEPWFPEVARDVHQELPAPRAGFDLTPKSFDTLIQTVSNYLLEHSCKITANLSVVVNNIRPTSHRVTLERLLAQDRQRAAEETAAAIRTVKKSSGAKTEVKNTKSASGSSSSPSQKPVNKTSHLTVAGPSSTTNHNILKTAMQTEDSQQEAAPTHKRSKKQQSSNVSEPSNIRDLQNTAQQDALSVVSSLASGTESVRSSMPPPPIPMRFQKGSNATASTTSMPPSKTSNSTTILPTIEETDNDVVMGGNAALTAENLQQLVDNAAASRPVVAYTEKEWAKKTTGFSRASTVSTNGLFQEPRKRETTEEYMGGSLHRETFDVRMEAISEVVEENGEVETSEDWMPWVGT